MEKGLEVIALGRESPEQVSPILDALMEVAVRKYVQ